MMSYEKGTFNCKERVECINGLNQDIQDESINRIGKDVSKNPENPKFPSIRFKTGAELRGPGTILFEFVSSVTIAIIKTVCRGTPAESGKFEGANISMSNERTKVNA